MRSNLVVFFLGLTFASASIFGAPAQYKAIPNDGANGDNFGASVAMGVNILVVGAPAAYINGNLSQGAVYVFLRSSNAWQLQQKLVAADGNAGDYFGQSVAIYGTKIVVGAPYHDGTNIDQGAVYSYTNIPNNLIWTLEKKIEPSDGKAGDTFGRSVAIDGDNILIGSPRHNVHGAVNSGAAYLYNRTNWSESVLTASDLSAEDYFGYSVSISGKQLVIGAPNDNDAENADSGSAYVFSTVLPNIWTQIGKVTSPDPGEFDYFGNSVGISNSTMIIGAPNESISPGFREGAAHVFSTTGSTTSYVTKVTAPNSLSTRFGESVAVSGSRISVGSQYYNPANPLSPSAGTGVAFMFTKRLAGWQYDGYLQASDSLAGDKLGFSVSLFGNSYAVGAPSHRVGTQRSGAAYSFTVN